MKVTSSQCIFSAPGLWSLFACAKILYRRLVDDVIEIFFLLHSIFRTSYLSARQNARVCMVTTVNICKVIFYYRLNHFFNCAALQFRT